MAAVVLDTDAASLLHKDRFPPDVEDLLLGNVMSVTFVTVAELFKWAEVRNWGERRRGELDAWLSERVVTLPSDHLTAKTWGALAVPPSR